MKRIGRTINGRLGKAEKIKDMKADRIVVLVVAVLVGLVALWRGSDAWAQGGGRVWTDPVWPGTAYQHASSSNAELKWILPGTMQAVGLGTAYADASVWPPAAGGPANEEGLKRPVVSSGTWNVVGTKFEIELWTYAIVTDGIEPTTKGYSTKYTFEVVTASELTTPLLLKTDLKNDKGLAIYSDAHATENVNVYKGGTVRLTGITGGALPQGKLPDVMLIKGQALATGADADAIAADANTFYIYTVTEIGDGVFAGKTGTKVELGTNLKKIGDNAFQFNTALANVYWRQGPSGVNPASTVKFTAIGKGAFDGTTGLGTIVLAPALVDLETIGENAFRGSGITLDGTGPYSVDYVAVNDALKDKNQLDWGDRTVMAGAPGAREEKYKAKYGLPNLVSIGKNAFSGCVNLKGRLWLPAKAELGEGAFSGCTGLTEVKLTGWDKTVIPADAFSGCSSLEKVDFAFERAREGANAKIGEWKANGGGNDGDPTAAGTALETLEDKGSKVTEIGANAFKGTKVAHLEGNVGDLDFTQKVKQEDGGASAVDLFGGPVLKIGAGAFGDVVTLSAKLGENTQLVGKDAFDKATTVDVRAVNRLYIEGEKWPFGYSSVTEGVLLPAGLTGLTKIPADAFVEFPELKTVNWSELTLLTEIGGNAFKGTKVGEGTGFVSGLNGLMDDATDKLKTIGNSAFSGAGVTTVAGTAVLKPGAGVSVGTGAFENNTGLKHLDVSARSTDETEQGSWRGTYGTNLVEVKLPAGSAVAPYALKSGLFTDYTALATVNWSELYLTEIGNGAFIRTQVDVAAALEGLATGSGRTLKKIGDGAFFGLRFGGMKKSPQDENPTPGYMSLSAYTVLNSIGSIAFKFVDAGSQVTKLDLVGAEGLVPQNGAATGELCLNPANPGLSLGEVFGYGDNNSEQKGLEEIGLPRTVTAIGFGGVKFSSYEKLHTITNWSTLALEKISNGTEGGFSGCNAFKVGEGGHSLNKSTLKTIGIDAFRRCQLGDGKVLKFGSGLERIGKNAFGELIGGYGGLKLDYSGANNLEASTRFASVSRLIFGEGSGGLTGLKKVTYPAKYKEGGVPKDWTEIGSANGVGAWQNCVDLERVEGSNMGAPRRVWNSPDGPANPDWATPPIQAGPWDADLGKKWPGTELLIHTDWHWEADGAGWTEVGARSFQGCERLRLFASENRADEDNAGADLAYAKLETIGERAFSGSGIEMDSWRLAWGKADAASRLPNLKEIGDYAFENVVGLKGLLILPTVKDGNRVSLLELGEGAFSGCTGLSGVAFGDAEETITEAVNIPAKLFKGAKGLGSSGLGTEKEGVAVHVGVEAYSGSGVAGTLEVRDTWKLGSGAFEGTELDEVVFKGNAPFASEATRVFANCDKLVKVKLETGAFTGSVADGQFTYDKAVWNGQERKVYVGADVEASTYKFGEGWTKVPMYELRWGLYRGLSSGGSYILADKTGLIENTHNYGVTAVSGVGCTLWDNWSDAAVRYAKEVGKMEWRDRTGTAITGTTRQATEGNGVVTDDRYYIIVDNYLPETVDYGNGKNGIKGYLNTADGDWGEWNGLKVAPLEYKVNFTVPEVTALEIKYPSGQTGLKKGQSAIVEATIKSGGETVDEAVMTGRGQTKLSWNVGIWGKLLSVENEDQWNQAKVTVLAYPEKEVETALTIGLPTSIGQGSVAWSTNKLKVLAPVKTDWSILETKTQVSAVPLGLGKRLEVCFKVNQGGALLPHTEKIINASGAEMELWKYINLNAKNKSSSVEYNEGGDGDANPNPLFMSPRQEEFRTSGGTGVITVTRAAGNSLLLDQNHLAVIQIPIWGGNYGITQNNDYLQVVHSDPSVEGEVYTTDGWRWRVLSPSVGTTKGTAVLLPLEPTSVITYPGLSGVVTIPETVKRTVTTGTATATYEYDIVEIGTNCFRYCADITKVIWGAAIPSESKVKKIGDYAFYGCSGLQELKGENTAFTGVEEIGKFAFYGCPLGVAGALQAVRVASSSVKKIGYSAFQGTLVKGVALPGGAAIAADAFSQTENLHEVSLTGGSVERSAFRESGAQVLRLTGGEWVEDEDDHTKKLERGLKLTLGSFEGMGSLREVTIAGAGTVPSGAFQECGALKSVVFNTGTEYVLETGAFEGCTGLNILSWPTTPELKGKVEEVFAGIPETCVIYVPWTPLNNGEFTDWGWANMGPIWRVEADAQEYAVWPGEAKVIKVTVYKDGVARVTTGDEYGDIAWTKLQLGNTQDVVKNGLVRVGGGDWTWQSVEEGEASEAWWGQYEISDKGGDPVATDVKPDTVVLRITNPIETLVKEKEEYATVWEKNDTFYFYAGDPVAKELTLGIKYYGEQVPMNQTFLATWTRADGLESSYVLSDKKGNGQVTFKGVNVDTVTFDVTVTCNLGVSSRKWTAVILPVEWRVREVYVGGHVPSVTVSTEGETMFYVDMLPYGLNADGVSSALAGEDEWPEPELTPADWTYDKGMFEVDPSYEADRHELKLKAVQYVAETKEFVIDVKGNITGGVKVTVSSSQMVIGVDTVGEKGGDYALLESGVISLPAGKTLKLAPWVKIGGSGKLSYGEMTTKVHGLNVNGNAIQEPEWVKWNESVENVVNVDRPNSALLTTVTPVAQGTTEIYFTMPEEWSVGNSARTEITVPEIDKTVTIRLNGVVPPKDAVTGGYTYTLPNGREKRLVTATVVTTHDGKPVPEADGDIEFIAQGRIELVQEGTEWTVRSKPVVLSDGAVSSSGVLVAKYGNYTGVVSITVPAPAVGIQVSDDAGNVVDVSKGIELVRLTAESVNAAVTLDGEVRAGLWEHIELSWSVKEGGAHVSVGTPPGAKGHKVSVVPISESYMEKTSVVEVKGAGVTLAIPVTIEEANMDVEFVGAQALSIPLNREDDATARVVYEDVEVGVSDVATYWKTSNASVVEVKEATGRKARLRAVGVGKATVTVALNADGTKDAQWMEVSVATPEVTFQIDGASADVSKTITALGSESLEGVVTVDGMLVDTAAVVWTVTPAAGVVTAATVSNTVSQFTAATMFGGKAEVRGSVRIAGVTHASGNKAEVNVAKATISFTPLADASKIIYWEGNTVYDTLKIGGEETLSVQVKLNGNMPGVHVPEVVWSSSDASAVTVIGKASRLGVPDSATIAVLRVPEVGDTVVVTAKVVGTTDSIRYRIGVTAPTVSVLGSGKTLQVEDTIWLKVSAAYGEAGVATAYTWTSDAVDTLKILPTTRGDSVLVTAESSIGTKDSVSITARAALGGSQKYNVKVIAPTVVITPALASDQTATVLYAATEQELSYTAITTVGEDETSRPLSNAIRGTAKWSSSDTTKVKVSKNGTVTSRHTGAVVITLNIAGVEASRSVVVPEPTLSVKVTADTNIVSVTTPLQMRAVVTVNGEEVNVEALTDPAVSDTLKPTWVSIDTIRLASRHLQIDATGLLTMPGDRPAGDSSRVAAVVKAYGIETSDTMVVYPKRASTAIETAVAPEAGVAVKADGLYLSGFKATDIITVYTIDGRVVLQTRGRDGLIPHPFRAYTLYIIETPTTTLKAVLRE
jgi:hypothetical protein